MEINSSSNAEQPDVQDAVSLKMHKKALENEKAQAGQLLEAIPSPPQNQDFSKGVDLIA